jgi:hypothetical protein
MLARVTNSTSMLPICEKKHMPTQKDKTAQGDDADRATGGSESKTWSSGSSVFYLSMNSPITKKVKLLHHEEKVGR